MPKIIYETKNFHNASLEIIRSAEEIINDYRRQGFTLTLRQLYYQFVARAIIPNTEQSYNKIGNIISDARRAGMIDWNAIEDRTRFLRERSSWNHPQSILESARRSYHRDLWSTQNKRLEVWIEKDALVGVIETICNENDIPFFSCRGYVSDSEMWSGAQRAITYNNNSQDVIILHLGDHDPSGIDMTRDITDRLDLFGDNSNIDVRRIALTMDQIEEINPPPNPAKITDSRYASYCDIYGDKSWELDALEPQYIVDLLRDNIEAERDNEKWTEAVKIQEAEREQIGTVIEKWDDIF